MEYEYDAELEEAYRASLQKVFRKTIDDGFFHFIILDCVNARTEHYDDMCNYAKNRGFKVYVAQMDMDVAACHKRNVHGRSLADVRQVVERWQPTPARFIRVDVRPVLQDDSIQEVEMEDTPVEEPAGEKDAQEQTPAEESATVSKWEKMDPSEERLDKLDGVIGARKRKESHPQTMQDYLQLPDDYASRAAGAGNKKRVRWADLEEESQQRKMRDMGFVVGQTDWRRMTDPTFGQSALTRTKYI
ncbi:YLP motif-containing protein 1-like [Pollicipes pollicipes]|uniref:YLP motif-containing protein 1-like n=1 Tax=Pollicipes pollicipes TaxID=41117 RepID=UPI0018849BB9|nr:YLP motif-containing protein 1-like [Pollicipes pollicipes]XP_037072077.1 YLP motif-containing protein 1-like [Pollicipes pollicipes]